MKRLFEAIIHMHTHDVVHRDIKPENILYKSRDPNSDIKIIDFGLSNKIRGNR